MEADVPEFQLEADHRGTPVPPSLPHPHAHHSRAPSADDSCIFITNVPSLPAPGRTPLETREAGNFSLAKWEMREQEDWAQLVKWSIGASLSPTFYGKVEVTSAQTIPTLARSMTTTRPSGAHLMVRPIPLSKSEGT